MAATVASQVISSVLTESASGASSMGSATSGVYLELRHPVVEVAGQ